MAPFTVTIHVEGFHAMAGTTPGRRWLGRTLAASLTGAPAAAFSDNQRNVLQKLLSPWRWAEIAWETGDRTQLDAVPPPSLSLDAYLAWLLENPDRHRFLQLHGPGVDDSDETVPIWPGLLAQLSRLGSQLSRPLHLAFHERADQAPEAALRIRSIRFRDNEPDPALHLGEVTVGQDATFGDITFAIASDSDAVDTLPEGEVTGIVDHDTRLVLYGRDEEPTEAWLAALQALLGRALDPISRFADSIERGGLPGDGTSSIVRRLVRTLLLGDVDNYSPDHLTPIFRSIIEEQSPLEATAVEKTDYARAWSRAVHDACLPPTSSIVASIADLLDPTTSGPSPDEDEPHSRLRTAYASDKLEILVRDALEAARPKAGPPAPFAARWLATPDNAGGFFRILLPQRLARQLLMPRLIEEVGGDAEDWRPLKAAFPRVFREAMERLTIPWSPAWLELEERILGMVFDRDREIVDSGAVDGLPFRVDTIFHDPEPDGVARPDVHLMLDGFLVALGVREQDVWAPPTMVTRGRLELRFRRGASEGEDDVVAAIGDVDVPEQVSFERQSGIATETRIAAKSYRGQAMIPWTARGQPAGQVEEQEKRLEPPRIKLVYAPSDDDYPALAYGRDYRVYCGYQAPGGLLPMSFGSDDDPSTYSADAIGARRPAEIRLRRTLVPGAPRLLEADAAGSPVRLAGADDESVRALWEEHVALWPAELDAERGAFAGTPTLFVDGKVRASSAKVGTGRPYTFLVRPPALALGKSDPQATTGPVYAYWRRRDLDWAPALGPGHAAVPEEMEADDPAVVGKVRGDEVGRGGVRFAIHLITRLGLRRDACPPCLAVLDPGKGVKVVVQAGDGPLAMSYVPPAAAASHGTLTVAVPPDLRCVLEARTACDDRFFGNGGYDARFDEMFDDIDRFPESQPGDGVRLFGASNVVIESLPAEDHLPAPDQLWRWIKPRESGDGAEVMFEPDDAKADFVGELRLVHQSWDWDGGPVKSLSEAGLPLDRGEPSGATRSALYVDFEEEMFGTRGQGGRLEKTDHSAGSLTLPDGTTGTGRTRMLRIEGQPNRGADYHRFRLVAVSRYKPFRAGADPDGTHLHRTARIGTGSLDIWKGYTMSVRRRDKLPTPRLSLAAPLFGRVESGTTQAGGVALYLDHRLYDTRHGGGLEETIEASILIEQIDLDLSDRDSASVGGTAALAIGRDPVVTKEVEPFLDREEPESESETVSPRPSTVAFMRSAGGQWEGESWTPTVSPDAYPGEMPAPPLPEPRQTAAEQVRCRVILGQTLEPNSESPIFPFSIAFLEPVVGGRELRPNVMARLMIRSVAGGVASDWSAPVWVEFLPDMKGVVLVGNEQTQLFSATLSGDAIDLAFAGPAGMEGAMARLRKASGDFAPAAPAGPYLVSDVWALLIHEVPGVSGEPELRVSRRAVVRGSVNGDRLRFTLEAGEPRPSWLRVVEVQRVLQSGDIPAGPDPGTEEATARWFGSDSLLHPDQGPTGSRDINERVVAVGPLVRIARRP